MTRRDGFRDASRALGLVVGVGVFLSGCQKRGESGAAGPLTLEALMNGSYRTEFSGSGHVALVNGIYENAPEQVSVQLLADRVARGDLNADGAEDVATLLVTNSGGSGSFVDLVAVLNRKGVPDNVARLQLGDRVLINAVRFEGRTIVVDLTTHGPGDALCCPTLPAVRRFTLHGATLREDAG